jgi:molecular chaperone DnaK (HSP70)
MPFLGIDLGTTNSVASVNFGVRAASHTGRVSLPSVVGFLPNGVIQVGAIARRRRAIDSPNTIFSSKRIIGRRYDDVETQSFRARYPFEIVETGGRLPAFRTRAGTLYRAGYPGTWAGNHGCGETRYHESAEMGGGYYPWR